MPALEISVDGVAVVTVSTHGLNVLGINVGGTQIDEELASLNVSGGSYPEGGQPVSLTWVASTPLRACQHVSVAFHERGSSTQPGRTIEELFPDEPPVEQTDFTPAAEVFKELRAKPKLREKFHLQLVSSSGPSFVGETSAIEHGFGFSVLWSSFHPEAVRVSLHAYTLDSLESRGPFNKLFEEKLACGASVELHVA